MKKIIKNLILTIIFIFSIVALAFAIKLTCELYSSPQLLTHITDPFPSYYVQDKMVERWENYCIVVIVFLSLITLITLINLLYSIIVSLISKLRNEEKIKAKKQARIEKLENELNELKKDGE